MSFQTEIRDLQPTGVIGERLEKEPDRTDTKMMDSADEANNVIGRAFTLKTDDTVEAGGTGVFAGIMTHSKTLMIDGLFDNDAGELAIRNGVVAELLTMGEVVVKADAPAAIGDLVAFDNATGEIILGVAGAGQTQIPNTVVSTSTVASAGVAVITLTI